MHDKIGIIQVRGLGDAIIAMPIAEYYAKLGADVVFALDGRWTESFAEAFPFCKFLPVPYDIFKPELGIHNRYWFEYSYEQLINSGCTPESVFSFPYHESHTITRQDFPVELRQEFYNKIKHRFHSARQFRGLEMNIHHHLKFDQYKYYIADVPFTQKWTLAPVRNMQREMDLTQRVSDGSGRPYVIAHLEGSDIKIDPEGIDMVPFKEKYGDDVQLLVIDPSITTNLFDWLSLIENAVAIVTVDSVFANLVDQCCLLHEDKNFILRSPMPMTPVLGFNWNYGTLLAQ